MALLAAIEVALALIAQPALVRRVSHMPLPGGVTVLLEFAAGDSEAIHAATLAAQQPQHLLEEACGFFIEQVMHAEGADSYRILGCRGDEPRSQLRRHMALLLRWLHPDRLVMPTDDLRIDRTVFAHRVTQAWEDLKTGERRAAYDRRVMDGPMLGEALRIPSSRLPDLFSARPSFHCAAGSRRRIHAPDIALAEAESLYDLLFDFLQKDA